MPRAGASRPLQPYLLCQARHRRQCLQIRSAGLPLVLMPMLAPGQELVFRADVGGFGAGSQLP